ncbi:MAG: PQQ-dependent sugar dehydrogenase [Ginsengibacter sp.]
MKILVFFIAIIGLMAFIIDIDTAKKLQSGEKEYIVDTLATGLIVPWAFVFPDSNTVMFTERSGKVRLMQQSQLIEKPILELADINTTKKMGMLGLCLHPDFKNNSYVYVAYNYTGDKTTYLRVVRYRFKLDTLLNPLVIVDSIYANQNHTGCRLKFGPDKKLYITNGDADRPALAQDLKFLNGKILRVNEDGSIPPDNPFVHSDTARKEIWTYGHRNTQGIDFQPGTNELYNSEHGPTGGDEINLIEKGENYGWPVIHHDENREGMVTPLFQYTPSIGPSEIVFYNANAFPRWKGKLLLASLRGESIALIELSGKKIASQQYIVHHEYGRIRALAVGPDGYLYFSTSQNDPPEGAPKPGYDMILRLRPSGMEAHSAPSPGNEKINIYKSSLKRTTWKTYYELCASCHGKKLQGTEKAKSMLDTMWQFGGTKQAIMKSIRDGIVDKGMPAWQGAINERETESLADYILKLNKREQRGR